MMSTEDKEQKLKRLPQSTRGMQPTRLSEAILLQPGQQVIEGPLTILTVKALLPALLAALDKSHALEIDLAQVTEIDAAGLQLLLVLKRSAMAQGKPLNLISHSAVVLNLLEFCSLTSYFGDPLVTSGMIASRSPS